MASGSDLVGALAAGSGILTAIGGGIKYIWDKIDRRITALEEDVELCEERHHKCEEAMVEVKEAQARDGIVIRMSLDELHRIDQSNPVLRHLKRVMGAAYPDDLYKNNDEFQDVLAQLNEIP